MITSDNHPNNLIARQPVTFFHLIPTEIRGLERLGGRSSSTLGLSYPEGPVALNLCVFYHGYEKFHPQVVKDAFFKVWAIPDRAKAEGTQTVRSLALRNTCPAF